MTALTKRTEHVCSCGYRVAFAVNWSMVPYAGDRFDAHMADHWQAEEVVTRWVEHDGVPTDRKPRVR